MDNGDTEKEARDVFPIGTKAQADQHQAQHITRAYLCKKCINSWIFAYVSNYLFWQGNAVKCGYRGVGMDNSITQIKQPEHELLAEIMSFNDYKFNMIIKEISTTKQISENSNQLFRSKRERADEPKENNADRGG